jgi:hypothetical protein
MLLSDKRTFDKLGPVRPLFRMAIGFEPCQACYDSRVEQLPTAAAVEEDLRVSGLEVAAAEALRRLHRRRTSPRDEERRHQIEAEVEILAAHSSVLRSHLKRSDHHEKPYGTRSRRDRIKSRLGELRYQRRQLKKMLRISAALSP